MRGIDAIETTPVSLKDRDATFTETLDLDIQDPFVRIPKTTSVRVEIKIQRKTP